MKKFLTISAVLAFVAVAFANTGVWWWDKRPTISLTDAVNLATKTLNQTGGDFYCLRADVLKFGGQCVWDLDFGSTNGTKRWVEVGADKSVVVRKDGGFSHD